MLYLGRIALNRPVAREFRPARLFPDETRRLQAIGSRHRRREYLFSRHLIRAALRHRFGVEASTWEIRERPGAAPWVPALAGEWNVSLSHSDGAVCVAIAPTRVGVDIQSTHKHRDFAALAGNAFSSREIASLAAASRDDSGKRFYRFWCAREAWYKALPADQQPDRSLPSLCYFSLREQATGQRLREFTVGGFNLALVEPDTSGGTEVHFLSPIDDLKTLTPLAPLAPEPGDTRNEKSPQ